MVGILSSGMWPASRSPASRRQPHLINPPGSSGLNTLPYDLMGMLGLEAVSPFSFSLHIITQVYAVYLFPIAKFELLALHWCWMLVCQTSSIGLTK